MQLCTSLRLDQNFMCHDNQNSNHKVKKRKEEIVVWNVSEVALGSIWPEIEARCNTSFVPEWPHSFREIISSIFMLAEDLWKFPIHHWLSGPPYDYWWLDCSALTSKNAIATIFPSHSSRVHHASPRNPSAQRYLNLRNLCVFGCDAYIQVRQTEWPTSAMEQT